MATLVLVCLGPATSPAKETPEQDWAENAAAEYDRKSLEAISKGHEKDALIYLRMAQIKRDAGEDAKAGKPFNWDEYHQLNGMLQNDGKADGKKNAAPKDKTHHDKDREKARDHGKDGRRNPKADHSKKDDNKQSDWKGKPKDKPRHDRTDKRESRDLGAKFMRQADDYDKKSLDTLKGGDLQKAAIYVELAAIKRQAASAAKQGQQFDWTRYQELNKELRK